MRELSADDAEQVAALFVATYGDHQKLDADEIRSWLRNPQFPPGQRGLRRAGLGVDAQNVTGAPRLYERVGMRAVRRSDNWRKQL